MAEFTAHFLYIRVYFSLISSDFLCKKSSRISPKSLVQSNLLLCFFLLFCKKSWNKKSIRWGCVGQFLKFVAEKFARLGAIQNFSPFFPFRSRIFFIRAERLDAASSRAPPLWHALPCPSAAREPHQNLASKNEGARPKLSWRLLSLSDLRLSQINANFT